MSIVVTITAGGVAYNVSDYVIRHSIEIDEYLFSPDSLKPNTNKATLTLSRTCPYIDEILAASGDIAITIVADTVPAFSGYLTDNFGLKITASGAGDMALTAEDPGIRLLKKPWESTDGLSTNLSGKKVCDAADTGNSLVHILAGLAGATVATGAPTISNLVYFSVQDKDKRQYWDVLEKVLADFGYVFYFNASGELALFNLGALTGTPSLIVRSDATILQQSLGDAGIEIKKRFIQYQETVIKYKEAQTVASAVIFRDTTGQGLTDCDIEIAAGGYYPESADASTYAYIDYFLEDGRDILAVGSATVDFSLDSGITYDFDHLGKSARIRFHNPTTLPKTIRKLKVTGSNVIAVKAESSMTSNEGGGKKLEYQADYLTANADAQALANLLRYVYANSTSLYTFRSYQGVLYPADTLYPSDTLYPLGDTLTLGALVNLLDPIWTSLNVNCAIYRKKYKVGKAGATFEALGIGTINLAAATARRPVAVPDARPIVGLYPTEKALASTSDAVDFEGQYGVYLGQRYVGAKPTTWTLDDAGQTAVDVAALVPTYTPAYLGAFPFTDLPIDANEGDTAVAYSLTVGECGIYYYDPDESPAWIKLSNPPTGQISTSWPDICRAIQSETDGGFPGGPYPASPDNLIPNYIMGGINYSEILGANLAFINKLFANRIELSALGKILSGYSDDGVPDVEGKGFFIDKDGIDIGGGNFRGLLKTKILETTDIQTGDTIAAPTKDHWQGSRLITHCAGLSDGWKSATGTFDAKTVQNIVKGSSSAVSYQSSDSESTALTSSSWNTIKTITSIIQGKVKVYCQGTMSAYFVNSFRVLINGIVQQECTINPFLSVWVNVPFTITPELAIGDTIVLQVKGTSVRARNFKVSPLANTIGVYFTDNTYRVIENDPYYDITGNIDEASLTDFTPSMTHWLGLDFINSFDSKVRLYNTQDVDSSVAFNSKYPDTIFIAGDTSLTITNTDASTLGILATGYYTYTGSVKLLNEAGKILFTDEAKTKSYSLQMGTDSIRLQTETANSPASILSIRSGEENDAGTYYHESTLSLHPTEVSDPGAEDWLFDVSCHDYSGAYRAILALKSFTGQTFGDYKIVASITVPTWQASTAYTLGYYVKKSGLCYKCTTAGTSGTTGPSGTGSSISDGGAVWAYQGTVDGSLYEQLIQRWYGLTGNSWIRGALTAGGGVNGTGGTLSTTQLDTCKIDDDSTPIANKSSGSIASARRSSLFSVYKPITVIKPTGCKIQCYLNGAYYDITATQQCAVALNPGRYAIYNGTEDTAAFTIYCVGVYGTSGGSSIWS